MVPPPPRRGTPALWCIACQGECGMDFGYCLLLWACAGHQSCDCTWWPWIPGLRWQQSIAMLLDSWTISPTKILTVPVSHCLWVLWLESFCVIPLSSGLLGGWPHRLRSRPLRKLHTSFSVGENPDTSSSHLAGLSSFQTLVMIMSTTFGFIKDRENCSARFSAF